MKIASSTPVATRYVASTVRRANFAASRPSSAAPKIPPTLSRVQAAIPAVGVRPASTSRVGVQLVTKKKPAMMQKKTTQSTSVVRRSRGGEQLLVAGADALRRGGLLGQRGQHLVAHPGEQGVDPFQGARRAAGQQEVERLGQ